MVVATGIVVPCPAHIALFYKLYLVCYVHLNSSLKRHSSIDESAHCRIAEI